MTDTAIQVFEFGAHHVRTAGTLEEPLFCAADVCAALGITNAAQACKQLGQKDQKLIYVQHRSGKKRAVFVTEAGLYKIVLRSRKPEAEPFVDWVTGEVLPSIRKHGFYSMLEDAARKQVEAMLAEHFPPALLPSKSRPIFRDLIIAVNRLRKEPSARLNPGWARALAGFIYECALDVPGQQEHRRARNPEPGPNSTDHSLFGDVALEKVHRVIDVGIVIARSTQSGGWDDWKSRMRLGWSRKPMQLRLMVPLLYAGGGDDDSSR